jgi:predicted GH43/DUF377 family glycosyl hydrolase
MKWKKLGKIFDPTQHQLAHRCVEFAQSPQTIVFDDFVRIYFSTREKDASGKYLSHISYIDMDKNFEKIIQLSDHTVIPLGELGCFDEHGIFPINVYKDKNKILAYTTGWNRKVSVSADASIGMAISEDNGVTFKKLGAGPVLTASLHEPFLVADAFVTRYDDTYHMWYIFGTQWSSKNDDGIPNRTYKIAHATSADAINWQRDGKQIIADKIDAEECQALPTVIYHNNRHHMYFCYRHATGFRKDKSKAYRIGYAYSENLIDWTRDDSLAGIDVSHDGWDSDMQCYPHIFEMNDKIYLLYNGNEFGRFGFGVAVLENNKE